MHWELWDRQSANLIEEFDSEEEALRGVRDMLAVNSPDLIDEISVGAAYDEGEACDVELPPALYGEALKSRLAEMGQDDTAEAARKVHARIRKWLAEEGWHARDVDEPDTSFNVMVNLQGNVNVQIFQRSEHLDHITIGLRWLYRDDFRSALEQLPAEILRDQVWSIYRDVTIMGVHFLGLETPLTEMSFRSYIYFDGLTKDALVQKIRLATQALALATRTLFRALEAESRSEKRFLSSEDLVIIGRGLPQTDVPLTRAS